MKAPFQGIPAHYRKLLTLLISLLVALIVIWYLAQQKRAALSEQVFLPQTHLAKESK